MAATVSPQFHKLLLIPISPLRLGIPSRSLLQVFPIKILYAFFISSMCPAYPVHLGLNIPVLLSESFERHFLLPRLTVPVKSSNALSTVSSDTLSSTATQTTHKCIPFKYESFLSFFRQETGPPKALIQLTASIPTLHWAQNLFDFLLLFPNRYLSFVTFRRIY
jgi:hypothetical protein